MKAFLLFLLHLLISPISASSFSPSIPLSSPSLSQTRPTTFHSKETYESYLTSIAQLPQGFEVYDSKAKFTPIELGEGCKQQKDINLCVVLINPSKEHPRTSSPSDPVRGLEPTVANGSLFQKSRLDKSKAAVSNPALGTRNWAGVFTRNKFPGAPIISCRERLATSRGDASNSNVPLQALMINNKVSNVCAPLGIENCEALCQSLGEALNLVGGGKGVLPSSTGVIGWRLPVKELIEGGVSGVLAKVQSVRHEEEESISDSLWNSPYSAAPPHLSGLTAARSIMTTDRYPKLRVSNPIEGGKILAIAKGAGMIEPNLATMLSYIMTDISCAKMLGKTNYVGGWTQKFLDEVVGGTYNCISVDGDESTSDSVVLVSSGRRECQSMEEVEAVRQGLQTVCTELCSDIVRNGEGTRHVIKVVINNFPGGSAALAKGVGKRIVNSPLFKCAVSGNDPNVGRLACAVGSFVGQCDDIKGFDANTVVMKLCGVTIFQEGKFSIADDPKMEMVLSDKLKEAEFGEHDTFPRHERVVEVLVDFDFGGKAKVKGGDAVVVGSDLTSEYVAVNADYRS
jgi:glutamate N-acetyltransferase/amino-acid N-acetyltransferase